MQKALAKSNEQSAEVNRLLEAIRESSQSEAAEIVRALRSGDDVSTALKGVEIVKKQSPWEMDRPVKQGSDEGAESPPPPSLHQPKPLCGRTKAPLHPLYSVFYNPSTK